MNEQNKAKNSILKYPMTFIVAFLIVATFVSYFVCPDKEKSEWENRYLATMPKLSMSNILDSSFMTGYEDYINDQLPMRDALIKVKAVSEAILLKIENNGIVRGKDSHLFTKNIKNSSVFEKNIKIIDQFISSIPNDVTVAIAPTAPGVLETAVPKGMPDVNQGAILCDLVTDSPLLKTAKVVNLKGVLDAHGDEYIYYRTDHHWTTLGAYYAYREILDNPAFSADSASTQTIDDFYGTLYAKYKGISVIGDTITYYDIKVDSYDTGEEVVDSLYDMSKADVFDKYGMFMRGNFGKAVIKSSECHNGKSLIIFKDSYANCLVPFLTYDYETITLIDLRYFGESVKALMEDNKDADVLFMNNFDFLNEDNHFYKLTK